MWLSFVVFVQLLTHVWLCDPTDCSTPAPSVLRYLREFTQTHVRWVSDAIQPSHPLCPLLSVFLLSIFPSIGVFSNESALRIRWPKYWSFSFSISPSNEYSGLISFRMDWFDLLATQGTLKSLLEHNSNAWILQRSAFGPTLTSVHDYWKNYMDICQQSDVSCFLKCCLGLS